MDNQVKSPIRVIVVDDIAETRESIRKLLQFENDMVVIGVARTGREGLDLVTETKPDVVLMDINMPDMDGITATESIKKRFPFIQVVIISVQSDPNYMRRAMLAGARDFLTKPPSVGELTAAIRRAGNMAAEERATAHSALEAQQLQTQIGEVYSRVKLYEQAPLTGRLVDEIELLVNGLAHDLRSPLNIILSILSIIQTQDPEIISHLSRIWRRCLYCKWVADNFLAISMSEKVVPARVDIKKLITEALGLLENVLREDEIAISVNVPDGATVIVDANLLRLVLMNLIVNAVENIIGKGAISISVEVDPQILITVEDDGKSVSRKDELSLFNLGFTTKKAHAGIGLYVARRLISQQNGEIIFTRVPSLHTNVFGVLLPKEQVNEGERVAVDVITGLEARLRDLRNQLSQFRSGPLSEEDNSRRQAEFKRLATTFSSNMGNELGVIETRVRELLLRLPEQEISLRESLEKIIKNCAYCRLLVTNILEIGEEHPPKFSTVSLMDVIQDVLSLLDRKMPEDLYKVVWEVDPSLEDVEADESQLKQVFMNLIRNALDAMPHGGNLFLTLWNKELGVDVSVRDTGIGIPRENLPRLFQLGFTTKPRGYGIGLYSIKNIITKHGGTIGVVSRKGAGATFILHLPFRQHVHEVDHE